jgi:hypothetical protein
LQPGLLLYQPPKSLRANSFQLIKFYCTQTDPAAETKSIGLQAYAQVVMVFASPSGQFYLDPKHTHITRTLQKRMPTLTRTATKLNRRAVSTNRSQVPKLATRRNLLNFRPHYNINNSIWTLPSLNLFLENFVIT